MVTGNMGDLMPVQCVPVLPGDTMQGHTSALIRVMPLNTPVMHPVQVRTHTFFVPNRIVFPEWEDFITGGNDGTGGGVTLPVATSGTQKNALDTYLGIPPIAGVNWQCLALLAVNAVFNEYYRDQDLVPERTSIDRTVPKIAWEKDYFSTARPWTQRGPDVSLPIGGPVEITGNGAPTFKWSSTPFGAMRNASSSDAYVSVTSNSTQTGDLQWDTTNLSGQITGATATVNDFRTAFALQRYQEARARYGARFTEYLRFLGITPSDARLQRPEYLGGGATRLSFSEVLQTTPTPDRSEPQERDELGVGDMYGHGIAGLRTGKWRRFFEEHGYVITMLSVRPKAIYQNGIPREFLKSTKEDYFQKELAQLGQQEIYSRELHAGAAEEDVFGYQDRYSEYRSHPSQVSQDFRDTLNTFHLARELSQNVVLNEAFVECDPSRRIFQVEDTQYDTLWCMVNNHLVARRMVPKRVNPRIL